MQLIYHLMKARRVVSSGYTQSLAKLLSGSVISQGIALAAMVVITRYYSAVELGLFAVSVSASTVLSVLATGRYEFAVMNPKDEREAAIVIGAAAGLGLGFGAITAMVALVGSDILRMLDPRAPALALGIAALTVVQSMFSVATKWANRSSAYGAITGSLVAISLVANGGPLLIPAMSIEPSEHHLIFFFGAAKIAGVLLILSFTGRALSDALRTASVVEFFGALRRHWKFPAFTLPHGLTSKLSPEIPIFFLAAFSGPALAGFFSVARRAMNQPMHLLATNVGHVFHRRLVGRTGGGSLSREMYVIFAMMAVIMVPVSGVVLVWGPQLFAWIFGSDFGTSGVIAQILLPALIFRMMAAPVAYVFMVFGEQWKMLILQLSHMALVMASFWVGHLAGNVWVAFWLYSGSSSLIYLATVLLAQKIASGSALDYRRDIYAEAG
ncbi:hypothetical protein [Spectribacter hydrogenoxidans]|uniref:Membrane protein involved in the export of O-antigen and teichoic acid n=1 Tax=Spectribacter hydrogenoxidans TaxID=3075608 RepID=A0ABU3C498_9GAMM|nr:hypothetical protein [Salinisphaera sp. W335]MDT0636368.1 hypothetical protein [Salinisphaera sp. W335]